MKLKRWVLCAVCLVFGVASADVASLVSGLSSEDEEARFQAFEGAAKEGFDAIVPVAQLLDHEDYYVVQAARIALETICAAKPVDARAAQTRSLNLCDALRQVTSNDGRRWMAWLISYCGDAESVPRLFAMLDASDLFPHALFALQSLAASPAGKDAPDIAGTLMARVPTAMGTERTALLDAVGAIGDSRVVPDLIAEARKTAPDNDAAIEALGRLGAVDAADVVWEHYKAGSLVALDAYLKIAEHAKPKVAEEMYRQVLVDASEPHVQCAALRSLAQFGGRDMVDVLVPYLASERNDVRGAAAAALEETEGRWVTRRIRNYIERVDPASRSAMLRVIASREGKDARDVLEKALNDRSPEVRVAALTLLGREPDLKYEQTFLDAAQSGADRPAALGAYLNLADSLLRAGDEVKAQAMYEKAMELATDNRDRLLAVEGLAQLGRTESLPVLLNAASMPGLEVSAGLAALAIAERTAAHDPQAAQATYFALLDRTPPRDLARRIAQQLSELGVTVDTHARNGVITNWEVIGPFPATSFDTVYGPEIEYRPAAIYDGAADQRVSWKPHHTEDIQGVIDLPMLMKPVEDVIGYARAEIRVEQAQEAVLRLGSDDGVKAWLNDAPIHSNNAQRRVKIDNDIVPIRLKAGTNVLLLKIVQGGSDWGYVARLTDAEGRPLVFEN